MKFFVVLLSLLTACLFSVAQKIAIATDRNNVLFQEVDNPITIAVEKLSCKDLYVTTDNGAITGSYGYYVCRPGKVGRALIFVSVKKNGKLKRVGSLTFRVKYLITDENIVFRFGSYGNGDSVRADVMQAQSYVRAELWGTDFDVRLRVERFSVRIISYKGCEVKQFTNIGNQMSNELQSAFSLLEIGDIIVFENIFVTGPSERKFTIKLAVMYVNAL